MGDSPSLSPRLRAGDRRALARAITLIESTRRDDRDAATALIAQILPDTGRSVRLGITGVPGVGKSTFIEVFGLHLIDQGHRVAVLAVDPTSKRSGGSILGDKTRMEDLSRHPDAFVRPSPAGQTLGGVARRTRETMLLCEAAGYDVVIVETVGVGQSETAVADMVDMFLLLLAPGGGDDLQGIKKGIVELADLLVVNKADGDLEAAAGRAAADYQNALTLLRPASPLWTPKVLACSALENRGIGDIWRAVAAYRAALDPPGVLAQRRADQAVAWMWSEIADGLMEDFRGDPARRRKIEDIERQVADGVLSASEGARRARGLA